MCDAGISAMTIASLAAAAAGTATSAYGAKQSQDAQNAAINSATERQKQLQNESQKSFMASLSAQSPDQQQKDLETATANRASQYAQADKLAEGFKPAGNLFTNDGSTGQRVIGDGYEAAKGKIGTYLQQQGLARANMEAFNDVAFKNSILNQDALNRQGILSSNMSSDIGLLPLSLQAASQSGGTLNGVGSILSLAGMAGGAYGARKNSNLFK